MHWIKEYVFSLFHSSFQFCASFFSSIISFIDFMFEFPCNKWFIDWFRLFKPMNVMIMTDFMMALFDIKKNTVSCVIYTINKSQQKKKWTKKMGMRRKKTDTEKMLFMRHKKKIREISFEWTTMWIECVQHISLIIRNNDFLIRSLRTI